MLHNILANLTVRPGMFFVILHSGALKIPLKPVTGITDADTDKRYLL